MPFTKRYDTFEVRGLMQISEGVESPVTNVPAHARRLHGGIVGANGAAETSAAMIHRTHKVPGESNSAFRTRSGVPQASSFQSVLQQSSAVTQALNSPQGQAVMRIFDRGPTAHLQLRATLEVTGIIVAGFLPATGAPMVKTIHKNDDNVTRGKGIGVKVIIDRGANSQTMHIQTCFPLIDSVSSSYTVVEMPTKRVIEQA